MILSPDQIKLQTLTIFPSLPILLFRKIHAIQLCIQYNLLPIFSFVHQQWSYSQFYVFWSCKFCMSFWQGLVLQHRNVWLHVRLTCWKVKAWATSWEQSSNILCKLYSQFKQANWFQQSIWSNPKQTQYYGICSDVYFYFARIPIPFIVKLRA